jgi:hypothetical protein
MVHISHINRVVGLGKPSCGVMPLVAATQGLRWLGDPVGCERPKAGRPA